MPTLEKRRRTTSSRPTLSHPFGVKPVCSKGHQCDEGGGNLGTVRDGNQVPADSVNPGMVEMEFAQGSRGPGVGGDRLDYAGDYVLPPGIGGGGVLLRGGIVHR